MDTIKIDARDVNFWYGDFHALKGISMEIEEKSRTVRMWQIDFPSSFQPDERLDSRYPSGR